MQRSIRHKRNEIFDILETETKKSTTSHHWCQQRNLMKTFQSYLTQKKLDIKNPIIQDKLINAHGLYGKERVNTPSDLIIALRYACPAPCQAPVSPTLHLTFVWSTCAKTKRAISIDLPKDGLWHRLEVPVPTMYHLFGNICVFTRDEDSSLIPLDSDSVLNLQALSMTLSADQKDFMYQFCI